MGCVFKRCLQKVVTSTESMIFLGECMRVSIIVSVLGLLAVNFVQAGDCQKAMTTPELDVCARQDLKVSEIELNRVYRRIIAGLSQPDTELAKYSDMRASLISAQRAWVKFREEDCQSVYVKHASGTLRGVMKLGCLRARADQRIKELELYESE
jgi:uncharacterized protein YecT (DUF1311 family)